MSDANEEHDKIWNVYFNDDEIWDDPNFDEKNNILYFASEDSSWTTGSILVVDGGANLK